MADKRAAVFFFVLAAAGAGTVAWLVRDRGGAEPGVPPGPPATILTPGRTGPGGGHGAPSPGKTRPPRKDAPPIPEEPGFAATRESCLDFLRREADKPAPATGTGPMTLFPAVRLDALEALQSLDPAATEPLLATALSGDGDPSDWSEERLGAAALRVRAGRPDGAALVRAFLKIDREEAVFWTDGAANAARAASWMPPAEGAAVLSSLLTAPLDEFDEDTQATLYRAVAALGAGCAAEDLRAMLAAEKGTYEMQVLGAAAGALKRLGDDAGKSTLDAIAADRWTDGEDFARGLGARGNTAVLPWLASLLACEDDSARSAAARAMGEVGDRSAVPLLQAALKDADAWVRDEAAVALVVLGDTGNLPAARAATASKDSELQVLAWKALALAGDAGSKDAAAALLASPLPGLRDGRRGNALHARVWAARLFVGTL